MRDLSAALLPRHCNEAMVAARAFLAVYRVTVIKRAQLAIQPSLEDARGYFSHMNCMSLDLA